MKSLKIPNKVSGIKTKMADSSVDSETKQMKEVTDQEELSAISSEEEFHIFLPTSDIRSAIDYRASDEIKDKGIQALRDIIKTYKQDFVLRQSENA